MVHIGETDASVLGMDQVAITVSTPIFGVLSEFKARFGLGASLQTAGPGWHPETLSAVVSLEVFNRVLWSLSQTAIPGNGSEREKYRSYVSLVRAALGQSLAAFDAFCAEECNPEAPLDTWGLPAKVDSTCTSTNVVLVRDRSGPERS